MQDADEPDGCLVEGDEPEGECLRGGHVEETCSLIEDYMIRRVSKQGLWGGMWGWLWWCTHTRGFYLDVNLGTQDLVPLQDGQEQHARVDFSQARDVVLFERGHPAEGVHKRGIGCEVAVHGILLLLGSALGNSSYDVSDVLHFTDCQLKGGSSVRSVCLLLLTWMIHVGIL